MILDIHVFRELAVALSYQKMRLENMDSPFLRILPSTFVPRWDQPLPSHFTKTDPTETSNYSLSPLYLGEQIGAFPGEIKWTPFPIDQPSEPPSSAKSSSSSLSRLANLFASTATIQETTAKSNGTGEGHTEQKEIQTGFTLSTFLEKFANHALFVYPRENKSRIMQWGRMYRLAQIKECKNLYTIITSNTKEPFVLFQLLEHYYCALETLCIPLPKGFNDCFVSVAFQCLPHNLFVQYMDRGLFQLSPNFLSNIIKPLLPTKHPTKDAILHRLVSYASDRRQAIQCLLQDTPHLLYIVQQIVSTYFPSLTSSIYPLTRDSVSQLPKPASIEPFEESPFLPLSVFMHALNGWISSLKANSLPMSETSTMNLMNIWTSLPYTVNNSTQKLGPTTTSEKEIMEILEWLNLNQQFVLEQLITTKMIHNNEE